MLVRRWPIDGVDHHDVQRRFRRFQLQAKLLWQCGEDRCTGGRAIRRAAVDRRCAERARVIELDAEVAAQPVRLMTGRSTTFNMMKRASSSIVRYRALSRSGGVNRKPPHVIGGSVPARPAAAAFGSTQSAPVDSFSPRPSARSLFCLLYTSDA